MTSAFDFCLVLLLSMRLPIPPPQHWPSFRLSDHLPTKVFHGIEPHPFSPNLGQRVGIEPTFLPRLGCDTGTQLADFSHRISPHFICSSCSAHDFATFYSSLAHLCLFCVGYFSSLSENNDSCVMVSLLRLGVSQVLPRTSPSLCHPDALRLAPFSSSKM